MLSLLDVATTYVAENFCTTTTDQVQLDLPLPNALPKSKNKIFSLLENFRLQSTVQFVFSTEFILGIFEFLKKALKSSEKTEFSSVFPMFSFVFPPKNNSNKI